MADHDQDSALQGAAAAEAAIATAPRREGVTPEGRRWIDAPGHDPQAIRWPQNGYHQWGAFPGAAVQAGDTPLAAVELGGYGDIEWHDPYSGRYFWLGGAYYCDTHPNGPHTANGHTGYISGRCPDCDKTTIWDAMRRLVDAAQAAQFPPISED